MKRTLSFLIAASFILSGCNAEVTDQSSRRFFHSTVNNEQTFTVLVRADSDIEEVVLTTPAGARTPMTGIGNDRYQLTTDIGFCTQVAQYQVEVTTSNQEATFPEVGYYTRNVEFLPASCEESTPGAATTFLVDSTEDFVDDRPGDGLCEGVINGERRCSLRAAIMEANANDGDDLVLLDALRYELTLDGDENPSDLADAVEDLDVTDSVTVKGLGSQLFGVDRFLRRTNDPSTDLTDQGDTNTGFTRIDGNQSSRIFHVQNGSRLTLENLAVVNGTTSGQGGGILNDGSVSLSRVAVTGNYADQSGNAGGGIANKGTLYATDVAITQNTAGGPNGKGGGLLSEGSSTVKRGLFAYNLARVGAAILADTEVSPSTAADMFIENTTIAPHPRAGQSIRPISMVTSLSGSTHLAFVTLGGRSGTASLISAARSGPIQLRNSLLMGHDGPYCSGEILTQTGNVSDKPCTFAGGTAGYDHIDVPVQSIGRLVNRGGFTPVIPFSPSTGSTSFDPTDKAFLPLFPHTDQRGEGYPRRADGSFDPEHADPNRPDPGAYEQQ